jgi:hypothetical protein
LEINESDDAKTKNDKKFKLILSLLVYTNFLYPVILILLYFNPLLKQMVVPDYISNSNYNILRIILVILTCLIRAITFRDEV